MLRAVWFLLLFLMSPSALAQEEAAAEAAEAAEAAAEATEATEATEAAAEATEAAEPSLMETLDGYFGTYLVGPMYTAMFFDLVFWDGKLPAGEGVGSMVGDEEVTGHDAETGYTFQKRSEAPVAGLYVRLAEPLVVDDGLVPLKVVEDGQAYAGTVAGGPLPAETCADFDSCGLPASSYADFEAGPVTVFLGQDFQLELAEPATAEDGLRILQPMMGPALVLQDSETGIQVRAAIVPLPPSTVSASVGSAVSFGGGDFEVVGIDGETAQLLSAQKRTSTDALDNPEETNVPLVVAWLVLGAVFFTLRMNFINLRGFGHAVVVTTGKYDNPDDTGEISHFQALSSALSATVGLGNIAGVAIAVAVGGPGAIFWMIVAGFLGMSSKFAECTLGQMYREVDDQGRVSGGPMRYLDKGLSEMGLGALGKPLAVIFAVMCIGGSLGGGNMFQANQSFAAVADVVPLLADYDWLYGIMLAGLVGMVILGGIKRIGAAASGIVPLMCGIYVLAALYIMITHASEVPTAFGIIVDQAFTPEAGRGGIIGVLIQGFRRAAFSNEAGIGSASIAHSAATTEEPVREGIVALLEPFIDTIIVCTMTGLVVVITGAYTQDTGDGVLMTSAAFGSVLEWFPLVLSFAVVMFAFSTMISWSYYGERCATYLFGAWASTPYKIVFLFFVFFGSVFKLGNVLDFSDLMVLGMAFPNILGVVILSGKVKTALDDYWTRLKAGEM